MILLACHKIIFLRQSGIGKLHGMNVYFISGLGADSRVFKHIRLPEGFDVHFVEWISPYDKETLSDYALRLTDQIDTRQPFILAGLSLGGIMSVEIAKKFPPVATILISSVPLSAQLPFHFSVARTLRIARVVPASFLKRAALIKRSFTSEKEEDKNLLRQLIREGNSRFIKWAVNAVLDWKNTTLPQPLWHIHGSRDEVFPSGRTNPSRMIPKGGHMILLTHAEDINVWLGEVLEKSV